MMGDLTARILGFFALVYLVRQLGAIDFGKLSFAEAFMAYFLYIGVAGVDTIATREIARNKILSSRYFNDVLSLKLMLACVAYLLLIIFLSFINLASEIKILTLLYGLCLFPLALSSEWFFQGKEKMWYLGLFRILREAGYLFGVIFLFFYSRNLYGVPIIRVLAMLIVVVVSLMLIIYRMGIIVKPSFHFFAWKHLLKKSYPILISQLLIIVLYTFPIILLGFLGKTEEVGYFSSVQKIIFFFFTLSGVFWTVIFPALARTYAESAHLLAEFERQVSKIASVFIVPVGIIGFFLSEQFIIYAYGHSYIKSIAILRLLVWVAVMGMFNGIFVQGLIISNREKTYTKIVLLQVIFMITLCLFMVPRLGGVGASLSWLIVELCSFYLCKHYYNKVVIFDFYRYLIKPVLASLIVVIMVSILNLSNIMISFPLCIIVYFGIMLIIKGVEISELKLIYNSLIIRRKE
jgi:O-antigen/teichoic acid export membrane protein